MAYNIFIFILFYSIAVVPCIGMYNKALYYSLVLDICSDAKNIQYIQCIGKLFLFVEIEINRKYNDTKFRVFFFKLLFIFL